MQRPRSRPVALLGIYILQYRIRFALSECLVPTTRMAPSSTVDRKPNPAAVEIVLVGLCVMSVRIAVR